MNTGLINAALQALEWPLYLDKDLLKAFFLYRFLLWSKQRGYLMEQSAEDLSNDSQVSTPQSFRSFGQRLAIGGLLFALKGFEKQTGIFHHTFTLTLWLRTKRLVWDIPAWGKRVITRRTSFSAHGAPPAKNMLCMKVVSSAVQWQFDWED